MQGAVPELGQPANDQRRLMPTAFARAVTKDRWDAPIGSSRHCGRAVTKLGMLEREEFARETAADFLTVQ